jgi:hypothetical protein
MQGYYWFSVSSCIWALVWIYGLSRYSTNQLAIHAMMQLGFAIFYLVLSIIRFSHKDMVWIVVMTCFDPIRRIAMMFLVPKWFYDTTGNRLFSDPLGRGEFLEQTVAVHFYFSILVLAGNAMLWVLMILQWLQETPPPEPTIVSLSRYLTVYRNGASEDPCAICTESLAQNSSSLKACGHSFHEDCIRQWLQQSTTCPICRADLQDTVVASTV